MEFTFQVARRTRTLSAYRSTPPPRAPRLAWGPAGVSLLGKPSGPPLVDREVSALGEPSGLPLRPSHLDGGLATGGHAGAQPLAALHEPRRLRVQPGEE